MPAAQLTQGPLPPHASLPPMAPHLSPTTPLPSTTQPLGRPYYEPGTLLMEPAGTASDGTPMFK
jgi:hypothetical protein